MKKFKTKNNVSIIKRIFNRNILLENNAQSGAVFRLMVDAIIGLIIMAMVLSTLSYFNYLKVQSSFEEFNRKILAGVNSPNGNVIESNGNLFFLKGTGFTTLGLQEITAYPAECFSFESNLSVVKISTTNSHNDSAQMLENTDARLFVRCDPSNEIYDFDSQTGCELNCVVSFGKRLENQSNFGN